MDLTDTKVGIKSCLCDSCYWINEIIIMCIQILSFGNTSVWYMF